MSKDEASGKSLVQFVRALVGATIVCLSTAAAGAETTSLDVLTGSWRGSGTMLFDDGTSDNLSCTGYYKPSPTLSVVIRCKGVESNFELRSKLLKSEGEKVSGTWEERTYNAAGDASGTASPGKLSVQFGGSLAGKLDMSFTSSSQSVSVTIETQGTGLKGARINFSRM